ncbi:hypothetical protein L1049_019947 [Liquidambar formosana]|uniref:RNase H type-1 domain-containing protein n=1 Tax=Liquidambar formosana TaxID=63359 RepID=A0AAP0SCE0_LIQFO
MKILVWNCRGAGSKRFLRNIKELVKVHNPWIVVIMETKLGNDRAQAVVKNLKFSDSVCLGADGLSRGLWMLWNNDVTKMEVLATSSQAIHVLISHANRDWIFSGLYASPNPQSRELLWDSLVQISATHSLPWILAGDFNQISSLNEKRGGSEKGGSRRCKFQEWVNKCKLVDLAFSGPPLTWCNMREGNARISERIDKAFANVEWRLSFPEAFVRHLPRTYSDHCPILIDLKGSGVPASNLRPFRFQAAWMLHHSFESFLRDNWNQEDWDFTVNLKKFTVAVKDWKMSLAMCLVRKEGLRPEVSFHTTGISFPTLEVMDIKEIDGLPTAMEVKNAVFSIGAYKAPGPDGMQAIFYHSQWSVLSKSVIDMVRSTFHSGNLPIGLNQTLITLIPKVPSPEDMTQFRPISLCNVSMKIISKILVSRLRPFLSNIIGPTQSSFILGRLTSDNILITQEAIHCMKKRKGKKGQMALKIDLSKAYDQVSWEFLHSVLKEVGLPKTWVSLAMNCVTSTDLSIIWNASINQIDVILGCLNKFCAMSGQSINLSKSKIFFSPNISRGLAKEISTRSNIPLTADLGKYLGVPIIHKRVSKETYYYVLEKVQSRLAGWKADHLSMASRTLLVQSVTSAIPGYTMQTTKLPESLCQQIDRSNSNGQASHSWRSILKGQDIIKDGHKWIVGNGKNIRFWLDVWVGEEALLNIATLPVPADAMNDTIWDYTEEEGSWVWSKFDQFLSQDILDQIRAIHPFKDMDLEDSLCWKHSPSVEDTLHVLRDCSLAMQVWKSIIPPKELSSFFMPNLTDWLDNNLHPPRKGLNAVYLNIQEWEDAQKTECVSPCKHLSFIAWSFPSAGWVKLNTDGSSRGNPGKAAGGGLIRDDAGCWLVGFGINIGICTITTAEIWALFHGLTIAWAEGYCRIQVAIDSAVVVLLLKQNIDSCSPHGPIVAACQKLLRLDWECSISHTYREGNHAADFLANLSHDLPPGVSTFSSPPPGILPILCNDHRGVSFPRFV